ncbi:hypothetical protein [Nocardia seriolae]|uniref:hypothetical protein n=1 Tax=Nocardia seriolae TaxID=37332 RepID=UPI0012BC3272|nr:hypothetical protein [Nocardia seriolae]MTJ62937.1 hypothetical protein [Nocardia seriolae]MTJ73849.1 hypothetical protein [Nocardia seriolae]MTJ87967.1 hypothetical protein [Nocardia seriolae]MTK40870.1 hypothetical protein [Nocardia seriolae]MTK48536.1 hypothetical protein [Nocardia seriolae]
MLVKVRNDDPSRLSSTERTVVNWLKSWSGPHAVPGIAVVQCQDADVVVWTPQTCVVVGVHGFTERVAGTLSCAQDQPWTVDGKPAPLEGDADPLERVRRQTVDLAGQLRAAPGREHVPVSGLVLLVPQLGSRVKLEKGALPAGIDVLIGDGPSSLRAYFTTLAEGAPASWDAAQVGQALGALGFAAAASFSDLVTEGFPVPDTARDAPLPFASRATEVIVPSVPTTYPTEPLGSPGGAPDRPESGGPAGRRPAEAEDQGRPVVVPQGPAVPSRGAGASAKSAIPAATSAAAAAAAYSAVTGMPPSGPTRQGPTQQGPGRGGPPPPTPIPGNRPPQPGGPPGGQPPRPPSPGFAPGPQPGPQPAAVAPPQKPGAGFPLWAARQSARGTGPRRRRKDLPIIGGLVLAVIILIIAIACTGRSTPTEDKQQPNRPAVVDTTSTTHSTDPTLPHTTIPPACFPLQPCG